MRRDVPRSPSLRRRARALPALLVLLVAACSGPADPGAPPSAATSGPAAGTTTPSPTTTTTTTTTPTELTGVGALETTYRARVGVWVLDTGTGRVLQHRADERFAHASTVKLLLAGLVLDRASDAELDAVVPIEATDILEHAPVTSQHVGSGMPLRDVAQAAIVVSDNTAANLLTEFLGGPAAVQAAVRALGNDVTTVDRTEPDLNEATPGDVRDTSTPAALGRSVQELVLGDVLTPQRRDVLRQWLRDTTTGDAAVRAGVPAGWTVGDKTGNGGYGTRNDVAVVQPADGGAPVVVVLLTDRGVAGARSDDGLLADTTRLVVDQLGR